MRNVAKSQMASRYKGPVQKCLLLAPLCRVTWRDCCLLLVGWVKDKITAKCWQSSSSHRFGHNFIDNRMVWLLLAWPGQHEKKSTNNKTNKIRMKIRKKGLTCQHFKYSHTTNRKADIFQKIKGLAWHGGGNKCSFCFHNLHCLRCSSWWWWSRKPFR